jgi:predicted anti-sigma-YlaC factor YlaD
MNCKKAREKIITDYLDDQMDATAKAHIEEHMAHCPECKKFYVDAKKVADELFAGAEHVNPPEYLWRRIRESIFAEEKRKIGFVDGILDKLRGFLYIPRPALAIISVVMLILAVGTITTLKINYRASAAINAPEQVEYFTYLMGEPTGTSINGSVNFGTPIEKYFM